MSGRYVLTGLKKYRKTKRAGCWKGTGWWGSLSFLTLSSDTVSFLSRQSLSKDAYVHLIEVRCFISHQWPLTPCRWPLTPRRRPLTPHMWLLIPLWWFLDTGEHRHPQAQGPDTREPLHVVRPSSTLTRLLMRTDKWGHS